MSKIITIFGATGNQGGSVAAVVLSHPELSKIYKVRAVTRDTTKPAAQKLKAQGAEVVSADMNDPSSLRAAVRGADTVFGVTNFWEGMDAVKEFTQGKNMADAAVAEGVKFFVFSSLPNATKLTKGHLTHIQHFDQKAEVEAYVKTLPIKSAFFWPGFFMQNFVQTMGPQKNADGTYTLACVWAPDSKLAILDVAADTGKFVAPLLLDRDTWNHKRMFGAVAYYTPEELVQTWTKLTGITVKYARIPDETYKSFLPEAVGQELLENMILMRDYKYFGPDSEKDHEECLAALGDLKPTTWEEFVAKNQWFQ